MGILLQITSKGMLPYLQFPDMQSFLDSLDDFALELWAERLTNPADVNVANAAIAIHLNERSTTVFEYSDDGLIDIIERFGTAMVAEVMRRRGLLEIHSKIRITGGRLMAKLTEKGLKQAAEAQAKRDKG